MACFKQAKHTDETMLQPYSVTELAVKRFCRYIAQTKFN